MDEKETRLYCSQISVRRELEWRWARWWLPKWWTCLLSLAFPFSHFSRHLPFYALLSMFWTVFHQALLIGTLIGGGGPIVLSCFTLTQPTWTLRTPVFLTSPSSLLAVDIWSATFVSFLYLVLTTPGGLPSLLPTNFSNFKPLFTSHQTLFDPLVSIFNLKPTNKSITNHFLSLTSSSKGNSLLDKQQAYVLCGIVLFTILALNRSGRYVLENRNGGQKASKGLPNGLKLNGFDKKSLPSIPKESTNVGLKKKNGKWCWGLAKVNQ